MGNYIKTGLKKLLLRFVIISFIILISLLILNNVDATPGLRSGLKASSMILGYDIDIPILDYKISGGKLSEVINYKH